MTSPDMEIVVAQLCKLSEGGGLGISLEGTVDVEDGQEVRPHHYIRSILPEGPVGTNAKLRSGDELLEVSAPMRWPVTCSPCRSTFFTACYLLAWMTTSFPGL